MPLYIAKVEIWTGVTDALRTDGLTLKGRATQLLIKYKIGALVTQYTQEMEVAVAQKGLIWLKLLISKNDQVNFTP